MAGILRTDTIQNSNTSTIITQTNSTTITIGTTGQTVALASGASSSGFGATYNGAVNWDTTAKTSSPVTTVSGIGYFVDTTLGAITVNLPAGIAGSVVALSDYAGTWAIYNVTVNANGTQKIGGVASVPVTLNTKGQAVTLVYVDSTRGWINTGDATYLAGNAFVTATGGTITTCGDYKIHTFTGPGTFTVTSAGAPVGSNSVDYLVVAGGGAGGSWGSGGGGAGGYRTNYPSPATTGLPVTATSYPITVGSGGAGAAYPTRCSTTQGSPSIFSTITSAGGGRGSGCGTATPYGLLNGGSGGGSSSVCTTAGVGNTPPVSPSQGNPGGGSGTASPAYAGGGGGGASATGGSGTPTTVGPGGAGTANSISGSSVFYAGGGGGSSVGPGSRAGGTGGNGGGGAGGTSGGSNPGTAGTANTGGGGGGAAAATPTGTTAGAGASGGSGIVVIRYKFQ